MIKIKANIRILYEPFRLRAIPSFAYKNYNSWSYFLFFCFYFVGSFTLRNEMERMKNRDQEINRGMVDGGGLAPKRGCGSFGASKFNRSLNTAVCIYLFIFTLRE